MRYFLFVLSFSLIKFCFSQIGTFTDSRDGKVYKTVVIGTQTWMAENLNVSTFRNGDPIPEAKTFDEWILAGRNGTPAWCYYNNDPKNGENYGKLYNWHAVHDPRGLASDGWKVPESDDFDLLISNYGGKENAGGKIKQLQGIGFKGLAAGARNERGSFHSVNQSCYWWCADWNTDYFAFYIYLDFTDETLFKYGLLQNKSCGLSVRCIKD